MPGVDGFGVFVHDQPIMARDKVRYVGEAVAAVAAEDELTAKRAAALIKVVYEPLPAIFDPDEAMKPGAPVVHDYAPDNVTKHIPIRKGDVEKAFAECDLIIENTYETQQVEHAYLEPEAGLAYVDHDGVVTVLSPSQNITHHRHMLARIIAKPINKVRFIMSPVGGGFGGKEDMIYQGMLALLAMKTGKPVRLVFTREESIATTAKRHPARIHYRSGFMRDGRLHGGLAAHGERRRRLWPLDRRRDAQGRDPRRGALRHPEPPGRYDRRLHQQHAVGRVPLVRRAADAVRHRDADGHRGRAARPRSVRDPPHQHDAQRRGHAHQAEARLGQHRPRARCARSRPRGWEKGAPAPSAAQRAGDLGGEGTRRACALDARFRQTRRTDTASLIKSEVA